MNVLRLGFACLFLTAVAMVTPRAEAEVEVSVTLTGPVGEILPILELLKDLGIGEQEGESLGMSVRMHSEIGDQEVTAEDLEEERRLCYVAMTRARERLLITHARMRRLQGALIPHPASRFIDEIPAEALHEVHDESGDDG